MTDALTRTHDRVNAIGGGAKNGEQAIRNQVVNEVLAIIDAEIGEQECAVELLSDLLSLHHEREDIGGGPGFAARYRAAIERAESFLGLDDTP